VAALVPVTLRMLVHVAIAKGDPKQKQQAGSITDRDVRKAQYVMLFSVIGRKNEISFSDATQLQKKQKALGLADAPHLYDNFKRTAQRAFRLLLQKQPPSSLGFTEAEAEQWTHALDVGKPNPTSILTRAMALAHDIDLMRCYGREQFDAKVKDIEAVIGMQLTNELCSYARALVAATGDRCLGYGLVAKGYSDKIFVVCSTNFRTCMERIHSVKAPSCMDQVALPVTPLTSPTKSKHQHSTSSGSSDGGGAAVSPSSALAAKFNAKKQSDPVIVLMKELAGLKLNSSDDLSAYDQLKFQHSKVIKMFASTSSCWGCFLAAYSLSADVIMNMYTRPDFFHTLNQALCQQICIPIVKMYAQVLSHALQEMNHDDDADLVVHRGVGYSDELLELYFDNIGEVVYMYNFTSTSRSRSIASKFASKYGARAAVLTIHVPKEMRKMMGDVANKSNYPQEQEMLIACNVGYHIDSVDLEARSVQLSVCDTSRCLSKTKKLCSVGCSACRAQSAERLRDGTYASSDSVYLLLFLSGAQESCMSLHGS
jgi:hypothetical protein